MLLFDSFAERLKHISVSFLLDLLLPPSPASALLDSITFGFTLSNGPCKKDSTTRQGMKKGANF